jgi:L-ribulose-5-phosphate 3-epimerase
MVATVTDPLLIGLNYRDFPDSWRPARAEITFAAAQGFTSMQFHGLLSPGGLGADRLGEAPAAVGKALRAARLMAVLEIIVRLDPAGRTAGGLTALDVLTANLPAIADLGCACVHCHFVPLAPVERAALVALEERLLPDLAASATLAAAQGFRFGIEHNEPGIGLFSTPERCAMALAAVPGLGFVWDVNHTPPGQLAGYLALTDRMTMLHIADTPLPAVNHHLPLGLGAIDFTAYCRALLARGFHGPAILEIGGLPASGGYGRDTDAALIDSHARLHSALASAQGERRFTTENTESTREGTI